jgi:hypothetical protein
MLCKQAFTYIILLMQNINIFGSGEEMKRIIAMYILLLLFAVACTGQSVNAPIDSMLENEMHIHSGEEAPSDAEEYISEEEPVPAAHEVPQYNDYHITLEVDPETRTVTGIGRIRFTNHTGVTLENVVLRTFLNAFGYNAEPTPYFERFKDRVFKYGMDYGHMEILHVSMDINELNYVLDGTVLDILLDEPLEAEQTVQFIIQFEAYVPKIGHRTGANDQAMWMGMFLPVLSVHDGQAWDTSPYYPAGEPFLLETAHYTVLVTTPPEYIVAGSGHKKEDMLEDKKLTTFTARMVRDFAFALSPEYAVAETVTESGVDVLFYHYSDGLRVDEILDISKRSMEYFEEKVGAYPYGQVSIVETDMFVNGMEFSKIVFMDSDYLRQTRDYTSLVHELGHQWFFNVVGNNPITDAWLDEGVTLYIQEGFFHEDGEAFREHMRGEYETFKNRPERWVIAHNLSAFENWRDYYMTHYTKAKLMMYALHLRMGDEAFWQFIGQYYQENAFRIARVADFIAVAEEVHGARLQDFFAEWLFGENVPEI